MSLLNELHGVKAQLDTIRRGPSELFKGSNVQAKVKQLEETKTAREQELDTVAHQFE